MYNRPALGTTIPRTVQTIRISEHCISNTQAIDHRRRDQRESVIFQRGPISDDPPERLV